MKNAIISAVVLGVCTCLLASCSSSLPTRAKIEAEEDQFCRAITRARELERDYGLLPNGGEAGAHP